MSAATAVHTSAQEVDLFGEPIQPQPAHAIFEGVLRDDARVMVRASDHGHAIPVVVLELVVVGIGHHHVRAERPYPADQRFTADARAATLKRGMRVRVGTQQPGWTLVLPHIDQITVITPEKDHA